MTRDGSDVPLPDHSRGEKETARPSDLREARSVIRRLHDELAHVKEQLRSMTEKYETAPDTMAASNEEMRSANEQLRAALEELETSKEELQSVADELRALNDGLEIKVDESRAANSDLHNLMNATGIGTIFLDRHLCIKHYTPQVEDLCGIAGADVGRPLSHLTLWLSSDDVPGDAARVLRERAAIDREMQHTKTRQWFLARFRPYHGVACTIEGVVITFVDITEKERYGEQLEALVGRLEELVAAHADKIKQLTSELILSEQTERERIAQILHDDLQQLLIALQMRMEALSHSLSDEQAARLAQADMLIARALDVARTLTAELSPPVLKGEDITVTLDWLALRMEHMHKLNVEIASSSPVRLPADMHLLVYQLVRELLFNVVKHAGVDRARVKVAREEDRLVVLVEDEGAGLDPAAAQGRRPATQDGFGLHSVRQRLSLLDGRLEADATPGRGTRMTLFVPLEREPAIDPVAGPSTMKRSVYVVD
jgi:two-component system CheB/CheR fusion protein